MIIVLSITYLRLGYICHAYEYNRRRRELESLGLGLIQYGILIAVRVRVSDVTERKALSARHYPMNLIV